MSASTPIEIGLNRCDVGLRRHGTRSDVHEVVDPALSSGVDIACVEADFNRRSGGTMREPFTQLYLHCVWATWDWLPLITPDIEPRLYAAIAEKCRELKCMPLEIGGIETHVHLLVRFPTTISVADLLKGVKGSSSHLIAHVVAPAAGFKWQGTYGAFTLRRAEAPLVAEYIKNQRAHHTATSINAEWEKTEIRDARELAD